MLLFRIDRDSFGLKRPRSYEKHENKNNRFGGSKGPRFPISVGEEYIVSIEEMGKEGSGVAKFRGVSIFVNNTTPGDKVTVRITKVGRIYAVAEVFNRK
jgi:predicted RNA-binding protein with TRAM domain